MNKTAMAVCLVSVAGLWNGASAEDRPGAAGSALLEACQGDVKADKKDEWKRGPKAESSGTRHHLAAGVRALDYSATAGTLVIPRSADKPASNNRYMTYN